MAITERTYKDIQKVNEEMSTIEVGKKSYAEVSQRIKAFRKLYPEGFILTEIISNENGVCVMKASVGYYENDNKKILGEGIAYEKEGSSFINKTSYIENCQTSAVGRALGMMGFGIDTDIASAEEMQNAITNQTITKTQADSLKLTIKNNPDKLGEEAILKKYKVEKIEDLTNANLSEIIRYVNGDLK
jgi:hypothetical protein